MNTYLKASITVGDNFDNGQVRQIDREVLLSAPTPITSRSVVKMTNNPNVLLWSITATWGTASTTQVAEVPLQPGEVLLDQTQTISQTIAPSVELMLEDIRNQQYDLNLFVTPTGPDVKAPIKIVLPNQPTELPSAFRQFVWGVIRFAGRAAPYMPLLFLEGDNPNIKRAATEPDTDPNPGFILWPYAARANTVILNYGDADTLYSSIQSWYSVLDEGGLPLSLRAELLNGREKIANASDPSQFESESTYQDTNFKSRVQHWWSSRDANGDIVIPSVHSDPPTTDTKYSKEDYWLGPSLPLVGYQSEKWIWYGEGNNSRMEQTTVSQKQWAVRSSIPTTRRRVIEMEYQIMTWAAGTAFGLGTPVTRSEVYMSMVYEIGVPFQRVIYAPKMNTMVERARIVSNHPI